MCFHRPASLKAVHPDLGTGSAFPADCNRLKWSLIRTIKVILNHSLFPQCCCWGFSCTRAGGAIRGWRRAYITCLHTMTDGRTFERMCSTTTRRAAGRRIRWAHDFCFKIDFRSQVRESDACFRHRRTSERSKLLWQLVQVVMHPCSSEAPLSVCLYDNC